MARRTVVTMILALLAAFSASAQQPAPAAPAKAGAAPVLASERVDKDTPRATPAGATFTVPAGWTMTTKGSMVVLDPPEPDSHVALVDVKAKDAEAAVAAAWSAYKPDFDRPLKIALPQEARQGWDERKVFQYETSPNERVVVAAFALRAGEQWT